MADLDDEAPRLEDIARAIATIEDSRQTHVEWIDYLARHGDDLRPHEEIAGDAEHHREAVEQYEQVLSVLRASAPPVPEGAEQWRADHLILALLAQSPLGEPVVVMPDGTLMGQDPVTIIDGEDAWVYALVPIEETEK